MKELHKWVSNGEAELSNQLTFPFSPWYHWHSGQDSNISQCFSPNDITTFKSTPWLTEPNQPLFKGGSVGLANDLEPIVKSTVTEWYQNRLSGDLAEATGNNRTAPKTQPSNIPRWMAHFLLTTTINIATSPNDGQTYTAPVDHFINSEMLSEYGKLLVSDQVRIHKGLLQRLILHPAVHGSFRL